MSSDSDGEAQTNNAVGSQMEHLVDTPKTETHPIDGRTDIAVLPRQQVLAMANPHYERLVKLVFEGRLIGETASRRSGIEAELEKSLKQIEEARKFARKQGLDTADPEIDVFLKQSCNAIESFNREVTMTCYEADNTCLLFKKQIESILRAGHSRSAANVYSGDEADTRSRLKRKFQEEIILLYQEICGRKKKGKLPVDATVILKEWWSKNLVWPYPSEEAKKDLEAQTGLSATQINNWFINQRKRHWHKYFKDGRLPQTINEARAVLQQYGIV